VIALILASAGIVTMLLWTGWGSLLIPVALVCLVLATITKAKQQAAIKVLATKEPLYQKLLGEYPKAGILWDNA
jgi:hypothetical protein